jgi:holo-[acyl-carrier protein] synthase
VILGIGTDLASVERVASLWERHRDGLGRRVFTTSEVDYCLSRTQPEQHLAGRFAAKEAALKALGTGWAKGVGLTDVEVIRSEDGRPSISFHGRALDIAGRLGVQNVWLSISHDGGLALALVVLEGTPAGDFGMEAKID